MSESIDTAARDARTAAPMEAEVGAEHVAGVYAKGAKVRLITDPKCGISVSIGKLNVPKVMEGRGNGTARIPLVDRKYAIQTGDVVYARPDRGVGVRIVDVERARYQSFMAVPPPAPL